MYTDGHTNIPNGKGLKSRGGGSLMCSTQRPGRTPYIAAHQVLPKNAFCFAKYHTDFIMFTAVGTCKKCQYFPHEENFLISIEMSILISRHLTWCHTASYIKSYGYCCIPRFRRQANVSGFNGIRQQVCLLRVPVFVGHEKC